MPGPETMMKDTALVSLACIGSGATGALVGFMATREGAAGSAMVLGALMFFISGMSVLAATWPHTLLRSLTNRGTPAESARTVPLGALLWAWLVYWLSHGSLGKPAPWMVALAISTALGILGLLRMRNAVISEN
jgi:hypothetical protein